MTRKRPVAALALALLLGAGCGRETVRVRGHLVKDGKPYAVNLSGNDPDNLAIDFVGSVNGVRYVLAATPAADGSFRVVGADGYGIRPGQYKITMLHTGVSGAGGDKFAGRYLAAATPLTVDITGDTELTIDVGKGTIGQ